MGRPHHWGAAEGGACVSDYLTSDQRPAYPGFAITQILAKQSEIHCIFLREGLRQNVGFQNLGLARPGFLLF